MALFMDKAAIGLITVSIFGSISLRFGFWLGMIPLLLYLGLLALAFLEATQALSNDIFLDPYYAIRRTANTYLHKTLPNIIIPGRS